jgi:hypothetical protein
VKTKTVEEQKPLHEVVHEKPEPQAMEEREANDIVVL